MLWLFLFIAFMYVLGLDVKHPVQPGCIWVSSYEPQRCRSALWRDGPLVAGPHSLDVCARV